MDPIDTRPSCVKVLRSKQWISRGPEYDAREIAERLENAREPEERVNRVLKGGLTWRVSFSEGWDRR